MFNKLLDRIEKPGRYVGCEANAYRKSFDAAKTRFALAFPDVYEVGLSHLGLRVLYHILNDMPEVVADRVYAPWIDFEERLRSVRKPLYGLESERPLGEFDFVGFSLQYELSYSNILTMLDLSDIPLEAASRDERHPFVIGGGPCAFNPEPLADIFDFFVLGEAEEALGEIIGVFTEWKASKGSRAEFLREVGKLRGVYAPSSFNVFYESDAGPIAAIEPVYGDCARVVKRLISDLDAQSPIPEKPLVPMLDIVHNRLSLDLSRGCTRGCRFCQAGVIYRPVRERDPLIFIEKAESALRAGGYEEVSLLSLSAGDYCQIQPLLAAMMERFSPEKVAVSFPSMRVGTLTPELMELVKKVRKTGFTLAPEAGSERLRRVINKGINDEDLLLSADSAFRLGWRVLKLYFMVGLPTECQADLDSLTELCFKVRNLAKRTKSSVNISLSTFVPKPHTPFQWSAQLSQQEIQSRLDALRQRLKRPGLRVKWSDPAQSQLEAVFARGDRRLGRALVRAWRLGVRFDGWSELLREDLWMKAFQETSIDPFFYAKRERARDEVLPWRHLSTGVEEDFLWTEYEKSLSEEYTPDCRWSRCSNCGVCDHESVGPKLFSEATPIPASAPKPKDRGDEQFIYWLRYSKMGKLRFFGQLETSQCFGRAVRRAGLPAAYTVGFHPHVKLSFVNALPLGYESCAEEAYLTLTEKIDAGDIFTALNQYLPEGLRIEEAALARKRSQRSESLRVTYRITGLTPWTVREMAQSWTQHLHDPVVKKTKRGQMSVEMRQVLLDLRELNENTVEMDLLETSSMCVRPTLILDQLWEGCSDCASECAICKTAVSYLPGLEESEDVRRTHHQ